MILNDAAHGVGWTEWKDANLQKLNSCASRTHFYVLCGTGTGLAREGKEAIAVEKVLISSFMTVVVFFSRAIDTKPGTKAGNLMTAEKAARALNSLACVEFCRRVQMQEYGTLVERCVSYLSAHPAAARIFAGFLPPYNSIIHWPGMY